MKAITETHRQLRRFDRQRIYKKRFKEESLNNYCNDLDQDGVILRATCRVTSSVVCSCHMCGNPRKYRGNSKAALTFQELIFLDKQAIDVE